MNSQLLIGTASGMLDAHEPGAYTFRILEIADALSTMNRFSGHRGWDSVASHAMRVSQLVEETLLGLHESDAPIAAFLALHHDSAEAYLGDTIGPIRKYLARITQTLEVLHDGVSRAIYTTFLPRSDWRPALSSCRDVIEHHDRADGLARLRMTQDECLLARTFSASTVATQFTDRHLELLSRIR